MTCHMMSIDNEALRASSTRPENIGAHDRILPIQQSTGISRTIEITGETFRDSSPTWSKRTGIKKNTVLTREEPKDRLLY
jgi:hypothetical protein